MVLLAASVIFCASACGGAAIKANEQQVQQQQAQIEQMQQQIAALKSGQPTYSTAPPAPGTCDKGVMAEATRRGGAKMATGEFQLAAGYYHDALTACPGNAQAEVNLARAYEALHENSKAISTYRLAATSTDPADAVAVQEARKALGRLGAPIN